MQRRLQGGSNMKSIRIWRDKDTPEVSLTELYILNNPGKIIIDAFGLHLKNLHICSSSQYKICYEIT